MGSMTMLNPDAGAVCAYSTNTTVAVTSIFEGELDAVSTSSKDINRITNVMYEMLVEYYKPQVHADNLATNNFTEGQGMALNSRHMQLRLWYVRAQYKMGKYQINHIPGIENPADTLTKLADSVHHFPFAKVIGLGLLGATSLLNEAFYRAQVSDTPDAPEEYPFLPSELQGPVEAINSAQIKQVKPYDFKPLYDFKGYPYNT